jgi:Zn-dependent peptidase ImmA (M78 family)
MASQYLPKESIEAAARRLLTDYGKKYSPFIEPPVDVCAIAESFLGLRLEYVDLEKKYGQDILGAITFEKQTVYINNALDPFEDEQREGRHNFTLAHEIGHWMLHRFDFLLPDPLRPYDSKLTILCRSQQKKDPREWQADQFATNLLMPRPMVQKTWREIHGNLVMDVGDISAFKGGDDLLASKKKHFALVKEFAQTFGVSAQAMRIRLADLQFVTDTNT